MSLCDLVVLSLIESIPVFTLEMGSFTRSLGNSPPSLPGHIFSSHWQNCTWGSEDFFSMVMSEFSLIFSGMWNWWELTAICFLLPLWTYCTLFSYIMPLVIACHLDLAENGTWPCYTCGLFCSERPLVLTEPQRGGISPEQLVFSRAEAGWMPPSSLSTQHHCV